MPGRFQVFGWGDDPQVRLRWRLISENGRQLALSPGLFATFDEAAAAACATRLAAPDGPVVHVSAARAGWEWVLRAGPEQEPLALSGRRYARRVELVDAIDRFRVLAATAEVSAAPVVFRRGARTVRTVGP